MLGCWRLLPIHGGRLLVCFGLFLLPEGSLLGEGQLLAQMFGQPESACPGVLRGKHLLLGKGGLGANCSLRTNLLLTKGLLPTQGLLLAKLLLLTKGLLLGKEWLLTNVWLLTNGRLLLGGNRRPLLAELFRFPWGHRRGRGRWTGRCSIWPAVLLIDLLGRIGRRWRNRNGQEILRASLDGPEGGF